MADGIFKRAVAALVVASALLVQSGPASAQQQDMVTLEAPDGSFSVTGQLLSYESEVYILDVRGTGIVKVEGVLVDCIDGKCPPGAKTRRKAALEIPAVAKNPPTKLGIFGSRTVGTILMPNLWRGYAEAVGARYEIELTEEPSERIIRLINPDETLRAEILLQTRGSGSAFSALADGSAVIGMADRRMKDSDLRKLQVAGMPDLRNSPSEIVVGVDGIVLITHPDNPVRDLSAEEVSRIFAGEITNWRELGGGDHPIVINSFGTGSGDRDVLLNALVLPFGRDEKEDVVRWKSYQDMVDAVMADRGGIGYVGRWLARSNHVNQITIRQSCGLLSPPSDFQIKIEGYSLSRRIYLYTPPGALPAEISAFLDWTRTSEAQRWVRESNFVDGDIARMQLGDMGMALIHTAIVEPDFSPRLYAQMLTELRTSDRLSVSLRFRSGSSLLDQDSTENLQRLAAMVERGDFDGMELQVVGFADSIGDQLRNTQLAAARAESVRQLLAARMSPQARNRVRLATLSFGELLPLACNDTDPGRARNRRVEVWLRNPNKLVAGR